MTIIRAPRPTEQFTVISNAVIRDHRLTFKARGLLIHLLSMPDHWRTNSTQLAQIGPDGRDAIRTALIELEQAGYVQRTKQQDLAGRWSTSTTIYDQPLKHPVDKLWRSKTTGDGLSDAGKGVSLVTTDKKLLIHQISDMLTKADTQPVENSDA
jgi:hypothetical protein